MRATSRGYVKIKSTSPYDHPIIQPNYLSTEEDRVELRDSIKLTREVFSQKAFDPFRGKELQPGTVQKNFKHLSIEETNYFLLYIIVHRT